MRILVDTHVFLWGTLLVEGPIERFRTSLEAEDAEIYLSAASLWEIRLKAATGRLALAGDLAVATDEFLQRAAGFVSIDRRHVLHQLADPPATKDPFDRMLLAQCELESMRLLTVDTQLAAHRLAIIA